MSSFRQFSSFSQIAFWPQMTRVYNVRGILLIIAGVHAFITTHIYEKKLFEHMSFGGIVGTWAYQLDLMLIFAACMCCSLFYERLRRRK